MSYPAHKKDPRRQLQGAVSRAQGQRFEETINDACVYYESRDIACIKKTPEPMRPTKDLGSGKFIAHYEKQAQPDYKGVLKGGRAVMFEAKFTTTEKMERDRVTREQGETLDKYEAMGAVCFILAAFDHRGYYRIPWRVWRDMKAVYGRQYVKPEELDRYRVPLSRSNILLFLDWDPIQEQIAATVCEELDKTGGSPHEKG